MTWLRVFIRRLRGLFLKRKLERELDAEIRAHLEMQIEENVGRGMTPDEAVPGSGEIRRRRAGERELP
jgi:putative ABC transport system permease protein